MKINGIDIDFSMARSKDLERFEEVQEDFEPWQPELDKAKKMSEKNKINCRYFKGAFLKLFGEDLTKQIIQDETDFNAWVDAWQQFILSIEDEAQEMAEKTERMGRLSQLSNAKREQRRQFQA